jgi:hypothetical protein
MAANKEILMKFITGQAQKIRDDISKQGYKDNSPYRNNPFNIIQGTSQGTPITMDGVSQRLYATDGQTSKILEPNSGKHFFSGPVVKEIPIAQVGRETGWFEKWKADRPSLRDIRTEVMNRNILENRTNVTQKDKTKTTTPKVVGKANILTEKEENQRAEELNRQAYEQSQKEAAKDWVQNNMEEVYQHPLTSAPGMIGSAMLPTGLLSGMGFTSMLGNVGQGNYKTAALEAGLSTLPFAQKAVKSFSRLSNIDKSVENTDDLINIAIEREIGNVDPVEKVSKFKKLINKPIIPYNKKVLPKNLEFKTKTRGNRVVIAAIDPETKDMHAFIDLDRYDDEWLMPNFIQVKGNMQGKQLQDLLYQKGIEEAKKLGYKGIRSGDHLVSPQKTLQAHSRFQKVPLNPEGRTVDPDIPISGLIDHTNPNLFDDFFKMYESLPKHVKGKYSVNDLYTMYKNHLSENKLEYGLGAVAIPTFGMATDVMFAPLIFDDYESRILKWASDQNKKYGGILHKAQEGQETQNQKLNDIKNWYNNYIESPNYKRNLEMSGYSNPNRVIEQRKENVNRATYKLKESDKGSYYRPAVNIVYHSPERDKQLFDANIDSESVLTHELGHALLDSGESIFGTDVPYWNEHDYNQFIVRNKNPKISRGADENYADQKALQYEAAKLGIYKPGYEEFTKEHLDKINSFTKKRALENYSEEDLLWLINNIAQNQDDNELPIAQVGKEISDNTVSNNNIKKQLAQKAVQIAEERIRNDNYINIPEDIKMISFSRGEIPYGCIGGVCTILKDAGVMNTVDWSNTSFAKNAKEYGFTDNQGWGVKGIENLEPGDILMTSQEKNTTGNYYPTHSQLYLGKTKSGQLRFFDNYWKYEKIYDPETIKTRLDPARKKTEEHATIYKVNPYNPVNQFNLTPEELQNLKEKKDFINSESKTKASYKWSVRSDAKNYNEKTKKVIDKFIEFANDNDKINDLVKKTGSSKDEIHDSLLNVFGELGVENNWTTSKGKGAPSLFENVAESIVTSFGGGKNLSVGPGQIKFNYIPDDLKEEFDIKSPNDLYNVDKVLPLMAAMDLRDKQVLENWGKQNILSEKLFGWTRPEYVDSQGNIISGGYTANQLYEDADNSKLSSGVGRYSPYLRNQYSSIASKTLYKNNNDWIPFNEKMVPNYNPTYMTKSGEGELKIKYEKDSGSYPYKVEQNWRNNLNRVIRFNEEGEVELPEVIISNGLTPATVIGAGALQQQREGGGDLSSPYNDMIGFDIMVMQELGGMLYANANNKLPHEQSMQKYLAAQNNLLDFMKRVKVVGGPVPFDEYYRENIINPRNKL